MKYYESILDRILEHVKSASNSLGIEMCEVIVHDEIFDADDDLRAIEGIIERALAGTSLEEIDKFLAEFKKEVEESKKRATLLYGESDEEDEV